MKKLKEFKFLIRYLKDDFKWLFIASILVFLSQFCEIFTGYLNGGAVEAITNYHLKEAVIFLLIYFFLKQIFHSLLENRANAMLRKIETKLTATIGENTYKKALDLPAYAYEDMASGEVINRVVNDSGTLSNTFSFLLNMFSSLLGSAILFIYITINSWIIGLEILIFMIILFLILKKFYPILKDINKKSKEEKDKITSLVNESVRGIREIKTLGIKSNLYSDLKRLINLLLKRNNEEVDTLLFFTICTRVLRTCLEVFTFLTCVILIYYGKISLTFFIAMTYYIYRYMWLIDNINSFTDSYNKVIVSLTRINEILENKLYPDEEFGNNKVDNLKGIIEFKNVTFGYPNEDIILKNFNLVLEPNKKIAVVGKSGQGKSTIFNLLTRVFDPTSGEILLDGVDIKTLTEDDLRKSISIIRQEPFIFNRTIKENFKIVDKRIKLDKIRKYTKFAYLDDYIMSLPKGYDTKLGEGGVNLSGGQKQRLAIARTLAKESKVILFDEATSSLDNNSQNFIKKAIDNLVKDHTVIIVAHRLSTIVDADIIYVIDKGKVVDSGTHKELLKSCSIYKKLYENEEFN